MWVDMRSYLSLINWKLVICQGFAQREKYRGGGGGGGGGGDGGGGGGGVAPSLIPQFSVLVFFGEGCSPSLTIPHHPSSLSFLVFLIKVCLNTLLLPQGMTLHV